MTKFPVLISIPHSSVFVPKRIQPSLLIKERDISTHADLYTDKIYKLRNAHVVMAKISRVLLDVNRAPDDIETECRLQVDGVVVRTTPDGKPIYKDPPSMEEVAARIAKYHTTFHDEIDELVQLGKVKFLIDGHSMWSTGPKALKDAGKKRADICLGNRDYTSCSREQTQFIRRFFEAHGYSVAVNDPYRGKFVVGYHCHRRTLPGIQIELNRALYLNERTLAPKEAQIKHLHGLFEELVKCFSEKFL